ncbi:MAG: glycosyltransferase family 2 protein [Micrococcales bacterium]|nr:glycosyltransferase family 2 protein [Micrococcales bacterium]
MLHAWRSTTSLQATRFSESPRAPRHRFTLMVPGRHEEAVMGSTLDGLAAQTHPDVEILAIVGDDDPGTAAVVQAAAARHPDRIRVVVDSSVPKNKPRALNTALTVATGDIVGVFDAEDDVHPELLRHIDSRFQETGAGVVQGGVQLMNFRSSWWALRNVLEYYFWFRSRLHFHAGSRFIPLGGNTVFIRRELLEQMNGWDAECLAEDCEIGVRLSSVGVPVAVAYSPEFVTREETPGSLKSLYKQRTRWNQGFLQVLRKKEWAALPTLRQRMFARYLLSMPFLQAFTGLLIPLSVVMILLVKVPTWVALVTFIPLAPTLVTLAAEIAGLGEFGRIYHEKVRLRDYVTLVLGTFPFQVFLALAAIRSVVRQVRNQTGWEKTEHAGAHRDPQTRTGSVPLLEPAGREPNPERASELEGALR